MATQMFNTTTELQEVDFEDASSLVPLSRTERAKIAEDTLNKLNAGWYELHKGLRISLKDDVTFCKNNSVLYTEDDLQNTKSSTPFTMSTSSSARIEVRRCTTLQAAQSLVAEMGEDHVGVLSFASAKNPGGGFLRGAQAQEESIARSSSLYLALTQARFSNGYYDYHRRGQRGVYSHRMIYSPRVTIFKDDNGKLLSSPYHVGIVTVAAPNAGVMMNAEASRNAMRERVKRLLYVFEANKHDSIVLGAFGCGVFKNNPLDVAIIFRQHLESKQFQDSFKRIIFAVLNDDTSQIFKQVFAATDLSNIQQQITPVSLDDGARKQYSLYNRNKPYNKSVKQKRTQNSRFEQGQYRTSSNYGGQNSDEE